MKKLKQLLSITMLTISCALLHTGCKYDEFRSATEPCGQNVDWTFDFETGALTITGDGPMETCPWQTTHRDLIKSVIVLEGITSIVDTAFVGCGNITSVTWNAKNCTTVDRSVFGRDSLIETFVFGDKVEVIPTRLCANLKKVTEIIIPNSVKTIGYRAFYNSGLTKVTIGNNVTTIGVRAFQSCYALNDITIPNSVTIIGDTAFSNCTQLKSVIIGDGVKEIGQCAFKSCSGLENVTFGSNVTKIKKNAFGGCYNLKNITIPDKVRTIEEYAFQECGFTSVDIGDGVSSIGKAAFRYCNKLSNVTIGNNVYTIGDYAFDNCPNLSSINIPNSVGYIGSCAFRDCPKLTSIKIYGGIGDYAFRDCIGLTSVSIYSDATHGWGKNVFLNCDNLASIAFEEGDIIPDSVCYGLRGLITITISDDFSSIGKCAFAACESLKNVMYKGCYPPASQDKDSMFKRNNGKIENLYVPAGCENSFNSWRNYFTNILPISE